MIPRWFPVGAGRLLPDIFTAESPTRENETFCKRSMDLPGYFPQLFAMRSCKRGQGNDAIKIAPISIAET